MKSGRRLTVGSENLRFDVAPVGLYLMLSFCASSCNPSGEMCKESIHKSNCSFAKR